LGVPRGGSGVPFQSFCQGSKKDFHYTPSRTIRLGSLRFKNAFFQTIFLWISHPKTSFYATNIGADTPKNPFGTLQLPTDTKRNLFDTLRSRQLVKRTRLIPCKRLQAPKGTRFTPCAGGNLSNELV
jgi:hypothetical protein